MENLIAVEVNRITWFDLNVIIIRLIRRFIIRPPQTILTNAFSSKAARHVSGFELRPSSDPEPGGSQGRNGSPSMWWSEFRKREFGMYGSSGKAIHDRLSRAPLCGYVGGLRWPPMEGHQRYGEDCSVGAWSYKSLKFYFIQGVGGIAYPILSGRLSPPLDASPCLISVHEWEGLLKNPSRGFRAVGGISVAKDSEVDYTAGLYSHCLLDVISSFPPNRRRYRPGRLNRDVR